MEFTCKRITLIASSYSPETCAPAKRLHALACALADRGHKVTMIAPLPNYPQGAVYPGFRHKLVQCFDEDGIRVFRLMPWIVPKSNLLLRLVSEIYFAFLASFVYLFRSRSDLVLASSPSMFVGPFGRISARITGARFVWDVRDLIWRYTQAIGERGLRKVGGDLLERLMVWTARGADCLTTTTEGQRFYFIERGVQIERTKIVPNGVSEEFFASLDPGSTTKRKNSPFRIVYAGLIGYPQGLGSLVSAARLLLSEPVEFVIAGEGVERADLMKRCEDEGITNVAFPGYLSQTDLAALYLSSDVLYAQLRGEPVFSSAQPSKIWEYFAAGKPVIYGGSGEAAEAVQNAKGGIVIQPDDPGILAEAILRLMGTPELCQSMGSQGRRFVESNLIRDRIMKQVANNIESIF